MPSEILLERADQIAAEVIKKLTPFCSRIQVAGSVRRRRSRVHDIDILLIPTDLWNFHHEAMGLGPVKMSGAKILQVTYPSVVGPVQVDLYIADESSWATLLLIRTGSELHNIKLATLAKKKGWHLAADGRGLLDENGQRIAGDTEVSIFDKLGLKYQEPEERE